MTRIRLGRTIKPCVAETNLCFLAPPPFWRRDWTSWWSGSDWGQTHQDCSKPHSAPGISKSPGREGKANTCSQPCDTSLAARAPHGTLCGSQQHWEGGLRRPLPASPADRSPAWGSSYPGCPSPLCSPWAGCSAPPPPPGPTAPPPEGNGGGGACWEW